MLAKSFAPLAADPCVDRHSDVRDGRRCLRAALRRGAPARGPRGPGERAGGRPERGAVVRHLAESANC